ncbi:hypothetical protein MtrunA17_Chr4g0002821 [Medicago truncatula]|uniref:Transmembrane protein n=1 Tax=Medicago truncatula TaxID=3880 RepID=A0A396I156_MEDTR|nr:hypothetical protein MtrunA17_Chr4g0002821 [Medicago truncatula]
MEKIPSRNHTYQRSRVCQTGIYILKFISLHKPLRHCQLKGHLIPHKKKNCYHSCIVKIIAPIAFLTNALGLTWVFTQEN